LTQNSQIFSIVVATILAIVIAIVLHETVSHAEGVVNTQQLVIWIDVSVFILALSGAMLVDFCEAILFFFSATKHDRVKSPELNVRNIIFVAFLGFLSIILFETSQYLQFRLKL
jgi:hypothetical protein